MVEEADLVKSGEYKDVPLEVYTAVFRSPYGQKRSFVFASAPVKIFVSESTTIPPVCRMYVYGETGAEPTVELESTLIADAPPFTLIKDGSSDGVVMKLYQQKQSDGSPDIGINFSYPRAGDANRDLKLLVTVARMQ